MYQQRDNESGIGSDCITESIEAYQYDFYQSYVPSLEMEIRRQKHGTEDDYDDPTIDLRDKEIALRPLSPVRKIPHRNSQNQQQTRQTQQNHRKPIEHQQQLQKQVADPTPDPVIQELDFLVSEVRRRTYYGEKLVAIMLNGLKETLGPAMYQEFASGSLPHQWIPIVRMNNDNCPYVEFLIKSDKSDHAPSQQLIEYKEEHLALSHVIVTSLQNVITNEKSINKPISASSSKKAPLHSTPIKLNTNQKQQQQQQPKSKTTDPLTVPTVPSKSISSSSSASKRPLKSTQIRSDSVGQQENRNDDLNDSRRIQPARKCRVSQSNSSFFKM